MNVHLSQQMIIEGISRHWVSVLFLAMSLVTIVCLVGIRWWWKRRWKRLMEESLPWENELELLPALGPTDQEALELIRRLRHEVMEIPESDLQLNVEALSLRSIHVVRQIAAVYFPAAEVPEYEASLLESLQLVRRVTGKLTRMASITPFKLLGNRRLSEYQKFYQVYRKINDNPILQALKRHKHIYKVARWAMNIKNISNPFYWAGKEVSREGYFFMLRWFYMTLTSQVGREAMRLYSGRRFQREEDRDAALVCYRLVALTREWDGPSPEEWAAMVDYITGHPGLDPEIKVHILSKFSQDRLPKDSCRQPLQTELGAKWYRQGLERLLDASPRSLPVKEDRIRNELAEHGRAREYPEKAVVSM